jgi:hypothetical protein
MDTAVASPSQPSVFRLPAHLARALAISQVMALVWWGAAFAIRQADIGIPVWVDQARTFAITTNLLDPYTVPTFMYPPWAALFFYPNSLPPLPLSTLIQACFYFAILTLVIFKYGGGLKSVLITFTSFMALDSILQLNIEWMVCIGLLVPPAFSGPFLVIKPQVALGVWLSYSRRDLVRALIVLLSVILVSLLVWGAWPEQMLQAVRTYTLGSKAYSQFNLAPLHWLPVPVSILIGGVLAWRAFRRRDPVLSILAWIFFVPYLTFYGLPLAMGLTALRWPRFALLVSGLVWVIYGGTILLALLSA